jgi:voltage-gated sodium channel
MLTLEGWVDVQAAVLDAHPWAWVYFSSFVFVAVFVVVNLFIAVVINNLESAKLEHQAEEDRRSPHEPALRAIEEIRTRLEKLERVLREAPPGSWAASDGTRGIRQAGAPPAAD